MNFVRIHFEMSPGISYWGDVEYVSENPSDRDYVRGWLEEGVIEEGSLESPQGIFIRESVEHGFLWFRKPEGVDSIGACDNVPYVVYEQIGWWRAYALHLMTLLVSGTPGVRSLRQEKINMIFRHGTRMSQTRGSRQEAIGDLEKNLREDTDGQVQFT
jgi:hypothetical protein